MIKMTATEFQQRPGEALDRSLANHIVVVKHGRPRNVILSYEEYSRLMRRDRRAFGIDELTDQELSEIGSSRMARGHEHLNVEIEPKRR